MKIGLGLLERRLPVAGCQLPVGRQLPVAGCRLPVNGRWAGRTAIIMMVFFLFLGSVGWGQGRRYSFKEGEILDYEVISTWGADDPDETPTTEISKYQFTVISAEKDRYCLSMRLISSRNVAFTISEQTTQFAAELRTNVSIARIMNSYINAVMIHPITFTMDKKGNIIEIKGDKELRDALLHDAEENPSMKEVWDFHDFELLYSAQKFRYQIQEIFPALPNNLNDTVCIETGNKRASRINIWHTRSIWPGLRDSIHLNRAYVIRNGTDPNGDSPSMDTIVPMFILWPRSSGYPVRSLFKGVATDEMFSSVSNSRNMTASLRPIEIVNTVHLESSTSTVTLNGTVSNLAGRKLEASLPGTGIFKKIIPVKPDPDGTFTLRFEMVSNAGLVRFTVDRKATAVVSVFVKPGDSVSFMVDLENLNTLEFRGASAREQKVLNQLSWTYIPGWYPKSKQDIQNNLDIIGLQKLNLDEGFVKFIETENRYRLFAMDIEKHRQHGFPIKKVFIDSLQSYRKYLGNPDGYKSDSYKYFINQMVIGFGEATNSLMDDGFDFAPNILTGWDLYWYRALCVERSLRYSETSANNDEFEKFMKLYPGTEYQRILSERYELTKRGRDGNIFPKFRLTDQEGKTFSTRKLMGQYWGIIMTSSAPEETKKLLHDANTFIKGNTAPFTFFIWPCNDSIAELTRSRIDGKKMVLLAQGEKNTAFAEFITGLSPDIMVIDPRHRIATHGVGGLAKLISWPDTKVSAVKTINLTTFWYSLAGAFILAIIIILAIRIRSKRREARMNLKRRIAQLEVDAVRSRMNPHFLFNALGSIQNLVNRGKNQEASQYLARFGDLVRTILMQSSKPVIGLDEEIGMIRNYLELEQLGSPFVFDILIDPAIDPATLEVPPLLIQPHVENAVIHGISSLGVAGKIGINFHLEKDHLICEVTDNGPGYHPGVQSGKEGLGQGWALTRQRIQLMKEQYGEDVSAEVTAGIPAGEGSPEISGTTVTFRLPMQKSTI